MPARKPANDEQTTAVTAVEQLLMQPPRFLTKSAAQELPELVVVPAPAELDALGYVRVFEPAEYAARLMHLRAPFPASQMEKLPKALSARDADKGRCSNGFSVDGHDCGGWHARSIHLDYVGHAGVTMRLLDVDPLWSWEPVMHQGDEPSLRHDGAWIRLTVLGMTRLGFGDAAGKSGPNASKEVIGDAIRNAALRFGVATYLWSKSEESQLLKAGGELPDQAPPPRVERVQPSAQSQRRARGQQAAAAAPVELPAQLDDESARSYRQQVLDAADSTTPGAERDAQLRALRDELHAAHGLGNVVELPTPWRGADTGDRVTLLSLIMGARTVTAKSDDGPGDDFDPWAVANPKEDQS